MGEFSDKVKRKVTLWYFGAFVLIIITLAFALAAFSTDKWVTQDSIGRNSTEASYGLFRLCYNLTVQDPSPSSLDGCTSYGSSFNQWPSKYWAVTLVFLLSSAVGFAAGLFGILLSLRWQKFHGIVNSIMVFSCIFLIIAVIVFPIGFGSTYDLNFTTTTTNGTQQTHVNRVYELVVCGDSANSYNKSICEVGVSYILAMVAAFSCIPAVILSFLSDRQNSGKSDTKAKPMFGGYA